QPGVFQSEGIQKRWNYLRKESLIFLFLFYL
ncbi:unnamed protein product, partial [marine sediment metagenome]